MDVAIATPGDAVAPTKLHVPAPGAALVPRDGLVAHLVAARGARLVLITGPAGAGTSTLLAQWRHAPAEDRPFAWLKVDAQDADPVRFWRGVVAALRSVHPAFGAEAEAILRAGPAVVSGAVVPLIAAEATALDRPAVLVLDDLHALGAAPDVLAQLALLAARLPPALVLAIGTRAGAPLPAIAFDALQARGELCAVALDATLAAPRPAAPSHPAPETPAARIATALAAGDRASAGALIAEHWEATLHRGERATVAGWIADLDVPAPDDGARAPAPSEDAPELWLVRLWAALEAGRADDAERRLATAAPPIPDRLRARGLLLLALDAFGRGDLASMAQSTDRGGTLDPEDGFWHAAEALLRGLEAFWRGHPRVAHRHFARAAGLAEVHGDRLALAYATGYLALIAAEGSDRDRTRRRLGRLEDLRDEDPAVAEHPVATSGALAEGRMLELAGAYESAVAPLERAIALADRGASRLERAEPLLRLASVHRICQRPAEAAACDARAVRLLAGCAEPGRLAGLAAAIAPAAPPRDTLSPSELAVLRLLPSGLSQRQIGAELYLSVNTVKTHCRNIYTKLRAASREQAVARAHERGLL